MSLTWSRDVRDRADVTHGKLGYFSDAFKPAYDAANAAQPKKSKFLVHFTMDVTNKWQSHGPTRFTMLDAKPLNRLLL